MAGRSLALTLLLLAGSCAARAGTQAGAPAALQPEVIAEYPHGAFLENLVDDGSGRLLITSYADRRLLAWRGSGEPVPLATLDTHPVGIAVIADRIVISAHRRSFLDGPAFTDSNEIVLLDRRGRVVRRTAVPEARFLNGIAVLDARTVVAADSIASRLWRFDPQTAVVEPWLVDPAFGQDPAAPSPRPAANGLKVRDGWLYVSNSARGEVLRVAVADRSPRGPVERFARTGPIDDFGFLDDGTIVATSHGDALLHVAPPAEPAVLLPHGCDGCTSIARFGPRRDWIVLTTGGLLEGGSGPARVLRIAAGSIPPRRNTP